MAWYFGLEKDLENWDRIGMFGLVPLAYLYCAQTSILAVHNKTNAMPRSLLRLLKDGSHGCGRICSIINIMRVLALLILAFGALLFLMLQTETHAECAVDI